MVDDGGPGAAEARERDGAEDIGRELQHWYRTANTYAFVDRVLKIIGVLAALAIGAFSNQDALTKGWIALLGFVSAVGTAVPELLKAPLKADRFMRAWRHLRTDWLLYKGNKLAYEKLVARYDDAEKLFSEKASASTTDPT